MTKILSVVDVSDYQLTALDDHGRGQFVQRDRTVRPAIATVRDRRYR